LFVLVHKGTRLVDVAELVGDGVSFVPVEGQVPDDSTSLFPIASEKARYCPRGRPERGPLALYSLGGVRQVLVAHLGTALRKLVHERFPCIAEVGEDALHRTHGVALAHDDLRKSCGIYRVIYCLSAPLTAFAVGVSG